MYIERERCIERERERSNYSMSMKASCRARRASPDSIISCYIIVSRLYDVLV